MQSVAADSRSSLTTLTSRRSSERPCFMGESARDNHNNKKREAKASRPSNSEEYAGRALAARPDGVTASPSLLTKPGYTFHQSSGGCGCRFTRRPFLVESSHEFPDVRAVAAAIPGVGGVAAVHRARGVRQPARRP